MSDRKMGVHAQNERNTAFTSTCQKCSNELWRMIDRSGEVLAFVAEENFYLRGKL